jgi:hypothetical protein
VRWSTVKMVRSLRIIGKCKGLDGVLGFDKGGAVFVFAKKLYIHLGLRA